MLRSAAEFGKARFCIGKTHGEISMWNLSDAAEVYIGMLFIIQMKNNFIT